MRRKRGLHEAGIGCCSSFCPRGPINESSTEWINNKKPDTTRISSLPTIRDHSCTLVSGSYIVFCTPSSSSSPCVWHRVSESHRNKEVEVRRRSWHGKSTGKALLLWWVVLFHAWLVLYRHSFRSIKSTLGIPTISKVKFTDSGNEYIRMRGSIEGG